MKPMECKRSKDSENYINDCLEKYDQRSVSLNENFAEIPTKEINGYTFHISSLSSEEFCKKYRLKSIKDVKWT